MCRGSLFYSAHRRHDLITSPRTRIREIVRLYLLADVGLVTARELPERVNAALRGGCTLVQLRAKSASTLEQIDLTRKLLAVCKPFGVPVVVNDRVDVALAAGANGVHLGHPGVEDMLPEDARRLLGEEAIIGISIGGGQEAVRALGSGVVDYVSAGPMFRTTTKADAGPPAGAELLREVRSVTQAPLVVIGGITASTALALYAAGADGLCVGSAILSASDPEMAARAFNPVRL